MKIQVAFYDRYFGRYYYSLLFFIPDEQPARSTSVTTYCIIVN